MKKIFATMLSVFFLVSCVGMTVSQYPDTPIGQAALIIGSYHDQVTIYENEISWAEDPSHLKILKGRLMVFQTATENMKEMAKVVAAGGTIPEGLLLSTKASLTELKKWLYARQDIEPSQKAVKQALVDAHLISENQAQGWESIVLLLIELIQAFSPMMDRLVGMGSMTPEQVQAEFDAQNAWIQSFNPDELPVPVVAKTEPQQTISAFQKWLHGRFWSNEVQLFPSF